MKNEAKIGLEKRSREGVKIGRKSKQRERRMRKRDEPVGHAMVTKHKQDGVSLIPVICQCLDDIIQYLVHTGQTLRHQRMSSRITDRIW